MVWSANISNNDRNSTTGYTLTYVPRGYEINQISPLDNLWFVLKISKIVGDAAHKFKTWKPKMHKLIIVIVIYSRCVSVVELAIKTPCSVLKSKPVKNIKTSVI